jgi:hypothetical protein
MDPATSDALKPQIEQPATDIDGQFDALRARIDEMFEWFPREMMIRFGLVSSAETAAIMAVLRLVPRP